MCKHNEEIGLNPYTHDLMISVKGRDFVVYKDGVKLTGVVSIELKADMENVPTIKLECIVVPKR